MNNNKNTPGQLSPTPNKMGEINNNDPNLLPSASNGSEALNSRLRQEADRDQQILQRGLKWSRAAMLDIEKELFDKDLNIDRSGAFSMYAKITAFFIGYEPTQLVRLLSKMQMHYVEAMFSKMREEAHVMKIESNHFDNLECDMQRINELIELVDIISINLPAELKVANTLSLT